MHNLFVVRTPLQLLSAYIVADQESSRTVNDLILINPRGESLWHSTFYLKRMLTDQEVWHKVIMIPHRVARRSEVLHLRERLMELKKQLIESGEVDQVYLGADREFDNQLLVELTGNTSYIRLEDGVWSYSSPDRSWKNKIGMFLWSRVVKLLTGIHTGMIYNYRGGGFGKAATADYLFKPQLLQRSSPQAVAIPRSAVQRSLAKLTQEIGSHEPDQLMDEAVIFLGSVFVDRGILSADQELSLLCSIAVMAKRKGMRLCYKPHPFENQDKLISYQNKISELIIMNSPDPIEFFIYCNPQLKTIISYSSSGLLYADVFSQQEIAAIALFKLFPVEKNNEQLERIMLPAGVLVPKTMDDLLKALS